MRLKPRSEVAPEDIAAYEQKHKDINRRILDRVARDPDFKEQLLANPRQALEQVGIAQEIEDLRNPEVLAHEQTHMYGCCDYYSDCFGCEW
jgi:hypothetical protein